MMFYCEFTKRHRVAEVITQMGGTVSDFGFDPAGLCTWRVDNV